MKTSPSVRRLSRLRLALATLLPVYPFITVLLYAVMPLTEGWTIWQRSLLIAPIMVFAMIFVLGPFVQKRFARFIMRAQ